MFFDVGGYFFQRSGTILAILVSVHPRGISVKFFLSRAIGLKEMSFKVFFFFF